MARQYRAIDLTAQFADELELPLDQLTRKSDGGHIPEDGHYVFHPNLGRGIRNIVLDHAGAFSNSLIQMSNAMNLALRLDIPNIYLARASRDRIVAGNPFWYVKPGRHEYAPGKFLINEEFDRNELLGATLAGEFFHVDAFNSLFDKFYPLIHRLARPYFCLNFNKYELDEDDLVLYIRSGNAFDPVPNVGIGQPPLGFYKRVVDSRAWKSFTIVHEDLLNPVIMPLIEHCRTRYAPVRQISGALQDDIEVLLSARTLTMSRGTFTSGVISISNHIKTAYDFADSYITRFARNDVKVIRAYDRTNAYVNAIYQANWANSPEQRQLMVEYDDIVLLRD